MANKTASDLLFDWFNSLSEEKQHSIILALYGPEDPRLKLVKGTYLGPSPGKGMEKRGYYLGPAPQQQMMKRSCPTCHRAL